MPLTDYAALRFSRFASGTTEARIVRIFDYRLEPTIPNDSLWLPRDFSDRSAQAVVADVADVVEVSQGPWSGARKIVNDVDRFIPRMAEGSQNVALEEAGARSRSTHQRWRAHLWSNL